MKRTDEQQAINDCVRTHNGDLLIQALAGTGKTWSLLDSLSVIPQKSILMCAFNKRIADELKTKLPKLPRTHAVHVKTFHALGLGIVKHHFPRLEVDADATEALVLRAEARHRKASYQIRYAAVKLLRQYKECGDYGSMIADVPAGTVFAIDPEDLAALGFEYGLFGKLDDTEIERAIELAMTAHDLGLDPKQRESIDFCDMVWMPVALNLKSPSRYQAVIVDEWQDLSSPQFELVKRMVAPNGRLIMAGDIHQAIYGWRGAIGEVVQTEMLASKRNAPKHPKAGVWSMTRTLPLTITWRCSLAVVKQAQELVPELKAAPDAEEGSVTTIALVDLANQLPQGYSEAIHTFVLSRTNADLLDCALKLWRERVKFQLNGGQEMLEPLFNLLDRVLNLTSENAFRDSLNEWRGKQYAKAQKREEPSTAWLARVDEQYNMLVRALQYAKPTGIKALLREIMTPGKTGVLLSTVHKVKGLEAERVFLLKQTFQRAALSDLMPTFDQEELNIEYVAITRAKSHLIWVDMVGESTLPEPDSDEIDLDEYSEPELEALLVQIEREIVRLSSHDEERAEQYAGLYKRGEQVLRAKRVSPSR